MVGALRLGGARSRAFGVAFGAVMVLLLVLGASARAAGEYELNDTRDTAYGPLEGGKSYIATIETGNDFDWYLFYVKTYSQMDFSATTVALGSGSGCCVDIRLMDKDGKSVRSFDAGYLNETNHLRLTLNPGRYYLEVEGGLGVRYRFQIDPPAALTTSRECGEAIVARDAATPQLAEVTAKLTKSSEALAKASAPVNKAKAALAGLAQHWTEVRLKWKKRQGKIQRHSRIPWFKTAAGRRLIDAKRRTNQRMASAKARQKDILESAEPKLAKIVAEQAELQTVSDQQKGAIAQAQAQIATHC